MKNVFLIILGILFSISAHSTTTSAYLNTVYLCNNCANFQHEANRLASMRPPSVKYYIADIKNNIIRAYVGVNTDPWVFDPDNFVGQPSSVDSDVQVSFSNAVDARRNLYGNSNSTSANVVIPSTVVESAWDMTGNSSARNIVTNYIFDNLSIADKIYAYEGAVVALLGKIVDVNVVARVVFSDESTALFRISGVNNDGKLEFEYVSASAVDGNSNSIPESPSNFTGRYVFNGGGLENFIDAVNRFGGTTIIPTGSCESGEMICETEGNDLKCTFTFNC